MFEKISAGMALAAAVMAGAAMLPGSGHGLVVMAYAADVNNQNSQNISGGGTRSKDGVSKTNEAGNKESDTKAGAESGEGIYDFKDNKTTGTVTITKKWDDGLTNAEREIPDMYLSTEKPSKSTKGYTITFHGNGLKFADGTDENMVVYSSSGQIVEGSYKEAVGTGVAWYANKECTQKVEISDDGVPQVELTGDLDLWAKEMTFEIKGYTDDYQKKYNDFNYLIPDTVTEVIFTDGAKPKTKEVIDVDADGDSGVVAWLNDSAGTVMKVSTQIPGIKVQAATDSGNMFFNRSKLQKIDLKMLDTQNVTGMGGMFNGCSGLTSLDLTPLDTQNVTDMGSMFANCRGLTSLDLTPLDTKNVTDMNNMFANCRGLTSLDLTPLNTQNVTNMRHMFSNCSGLTSLDLTPLDTSKATSMEAIFYNCRGLTSLDLTSLDTKNVTSMRNMFSDCFGLTSLDLMPLDTESVTDMSSMFFNCRGLTGLDLTSLNTSNVKSMEYMFYDCSGLTSLNLTPLNTSKVTSMYQMFGDCSALTSLDLAPLNTQNVTNMDGMFSGCSGLTSLDLTPLNTKNVTNMGSMFCNCRGLTSLDLSPLDTRRVTDMWDMFSGCSGLTSLDLSPLDTKNVTSMGYMFSECISLTNLATGTSFKFVGTDYRLSGTWQNTAGEIFNGNDGTANFPSNVADTYTKVSS